MTGRRNPWLEQFEQANVAEKIQIVWKVAHLETMNSVSKEALRVMFRWFVDYALEEDR